MKKGNKYDVLFETLAKEFSKIENIEIINTNDDARRLFFFSMKRMFEIENYKVLFLNSFIPSCNQAIAEGAKALKSSKYNHLFTGAREELNENLNETIRLGYVGMFHKFENYIDDLIVQAELVASCNEQNGFIEPFVKEQYQKKIKDWKSCKSINRINWICNCIKHYDSFPKKQPIHEDFISYPSTSRLVFTKDDFKRDIDKLIEFYTIYMRLVFFLAQSYLIHEWEKEDSGDEEFEVVKAKVKKYVESYFLLLGMM